MVSHVSHRPWPEIELLREGIEPDERKKHLIMARTLSELEAPKPIVTFSGQEIIAQAGVVICYRPDSKIRPHLDSYEQWPVEPGVFTETYRAWDQPSWMPSPAEKHLMELGCQPYYKIAGTWAEKLEKPALSETQEAEPTRAWLGPTHSMGGSNHAGRYARHSSGAFKGFWKRIQWLLRSS